MRQWNLDTLKEKKLLIGMEAAPMEENRPQMDVDSVPNESNRVLRRLESFDIRCELSSR